MPSKRASEDLTETAGDFRLEKNLSKNEHNFKPDSIA